MLSRRGFLQGAALIPFMEFPAFGKEVPLQFHDQRGTNLLNDSLNDPQFWKKSLITKYEGLLFDEIRLKIKEEGYVSYISGTGRQNFTPEEVADGIFKHQDLIPKFMPSLRSARYIGRGVDPFNGLEYTDIFFLADIKIFFMSVPLRTYKIKIGENKYVCAIELITEDMVSAEKWRTYQQIISLEHEGLSDRWSFQTIVPMEYVFGFYLTEPEIEFGTRVTMITRMKFAKNANVLADIGSELPFVLRQGMQAGFIGSVFACREYLKN
jgi:hypothetical protein